MAHDAIARSLWEEELALVKAAVSRAAEVYAQTPGLAHHHPEAFATAEDAVYELYARPDLAPLLSDTALRDLVFEAIAEGIDQARKVERVMAQMARNRERDHEGYERGR